jgi:hypothetical protein
MLNGASPIQFNQGSTAGYKNLKPTQALSFNPLR